MKLSERLEAMAGSSMFDMEEVCALLEEAAALARRVEDAHREYVCRVYDCDKGEYRGEVINTVPVHLAGKHVRLVPEAGQGGGDV